MYKHDLALNNLQGLICHKTQPTKHSVPSVSRNLQWLRSENSVKFKVTCTEKYVIGLKTVHKWAKHGFATMNQT